MQNDNPKLNKYSDTLVSIGLKEQESVVYLALLELGETTVSPLAKKSGVHRTFVYDLLESLAEKGLVSYIEKKGRRHYIASDPLTLKTQVRETERDLDQIMPDLLSMYSTPKSRPEMRFFEGRKGIEVVDKEVLKEAKEICFFGSAETWMQEFPNFAEYTKEQVKKNVRIRDLVCFGEDVREYARYYDPKLQELRYLPKGIKLRTDNIIWGNKVALVSYTKQHAVVIESEEIVATMREMFEVLWKMADKK